MPGLPKGLIKSSEREDAEEHVLYGEGFKAVRVTQCETVTAMANLAIINCQIHGRNALNLKVFCLTNLQVLILRNNLIKEIPSEIQQLKLFSLFYLEELDISYNKIAFIPNEIQKLRFLDKLVVDGNELTTFPAAILKLNLKKILFENNFTYPILWKENSLNSLQCLTQLSSLFFLKNDLHKHYDVIPVKIQNLLM
ncbi:hypothetical protein MC885_010498, partial [Smutsia gigantea]